jgi:hypothetical protein
MATAITYYVHEGSRDGLFTACRGQVIGSSLRRGKWHGPFQNRSKAVAKLASVPSISVRAFVRMY